MPGTTRSDVLADRAELGERSLTRESYVQRGRTRSAHLTGKAVLARHAPTLDERGSHERHRDRRLPLRVGSVEPEAIARERDVRAALVAEHDGRSRHAGQWEQRDAVDLERRRPPRVTPERRECRLALSPQFS